MFHFPLKKPPDLILRCTVHIKSSHYLRQCNIPTDRVSRGLAPGLSVSLRPSSQVQNILPRASGQLSTVLWSCIAPSTCSDILEDLARPLQLSQLLLEAKQKSSASASILFPSWVSPALVISPQSRLSWPSSAFASSQAGRQAEWLVWGLLFTSVYPCVWFASTCVWQFLAVPMGASPQHLK